MPVAAQRTCPACRRAPSRHPRGSVCAPASALTRWVFVGRLAGRGLAMLGVRSACQVPARVPRCCPCCVCSASPLPCPTAACALVAAQGGGAAAAASPAAGAGGRQRRRRRQRWPHQWWAWRQAAAAATCVGSGSRDGGRSVSGWSASLLARLLHAYPITKCVTRYFGKSSNQFRCTSY
jgi:hypothetical protein